MRSLLVTALDGAQWTVRVVWEPRWRPLARRFGGWRRTRKKRRSEDAVDDAVQLSDAVPTGSGGSGGGGFGDVMVVVVVVCIGVIAAAALFWWVLLPLLLIVIDLVVVLVLLVLAIVGRVLFRRPWTVQAKTGGGERVAVEVVGWRAALRRRDELAESLRRGDGRPMSPACGSRTHSSRP